MAERLLRVLALALGVVPVLTGAAAPDCALPVTSDPSILTMGRDRRAHVLVRTAGELPQLAASVGRLENVRAEGGGTFSAEYVPPRQGHPQVAVIAAREGEACGWTAIRLVGNGEAVVRSRPRASINLRIGERRFGPVTADADGRAVVPIEVPPGVRRAYHGEQEIELDLPPSRHLAGLAHPTAVPADVESSVDVLLVAAEDDGTPRPVARVAWSATEGGLSEPERAGIGTFRARWTIPPGKAGAVSLLVHLAGEEPAAIVVRRVPGAPATLALSTDRPRVVAGEAAPLSVSVALRDASGNPADAEVRITPSLGEAGPVERTAAGSYRAAIVVPAVIGSRAALALAAEAGSARAESTVALAPAEAARLAVEAAEAVLANGRAVAAVRVELTDRHGNPVAEPVPEGAAGAGAVGAARADGPGRFLLDYRPGELVRDAGDVVRISAGPLRADRAIRLLAPMATLTLAPHAGIVLPVGGSGGPRTGLEVARWWRAGGEQLGVALDGTWAAVGSRDRVALPSGSLAVEGEVQYVTALLSGAWRRVLGRRSMVWLSAGAGAVHATSRMTIAGQPTVVESAWAPAASAAAAFGRRLGAGHLFGELRTTWQGDPGLASVRGGFVPISLSLGYRLGLR